MRRSITTALAYGFLLASCGAVAAAHAEGEVLHPVLAANPVLGRHTATLASLAASAANVGALAALHGARPGEAPRHLMPDGTPTNAARPAGKLLTNLHANVTLGNGAQSQIGGVSGFTGITEGINAQANGSELEPPDQGMAANGGIVGEVVNNTIAFYQNGVALTKPLANATFFGLPITAGLSDPHIVFDPSVQRWFVDELTYGTGPGSGFYLAVSDTANPLGSYTTYLIDASSTDVKGCGKGCLADYPQIGFDSNGVYIAADLFGPRRFVATGFFAIPKAALITGGAFTPLRFTLPDFVVQPSVPAAGEPFSLANNGTEYAMTARNIYNGSQKLRVWAIENTFNLATDPSSLIATSADATGESYAGTVPSTEPNDVGPYGLSQGATTSPQLDGGYNAFSANVKLAGGHLYAALTSGAVDTQGLPRDVIAWFEVKPHYSMDGKLHAKILNQGYVVPPDGYSISYPGFALTHTGHGILGVTITSPDAAAVGGYPSTAYVSFDKSKAGKTITVTGQGGASDDGFTGYNGPGPAGVGRWGDFASATVDVTTGAFYVANEFIPDPEVFPRGTFANWGTYVTEVR